MLVDIKCDNILKMGNQLLNLEYLYKKCANEDVKSWLYGCKNYEYSFRDGIWCDFCNRGYPIKVTKVFLRESDKSVMVGGTNMLDDKEDEEFFSYMMNLRQIQQVVEQLIPSFYVY